MASSKAWGIVMPVSRHRTLSWTQSSLETLVNFRFRLGVTIVTSVGLCALCTWALLCYIGNKLSRCHGNIWSENLEEDRKCLKKKSG